MKKFNGRLAFAMAFLGLFAAVVFARYAQLAFAEEKAGSSSQDYTGERGAIVDRNGRILAMEVPKYDVSVWRPSTKPEVFLNEIPELATLIGVPAEQIGEKYSDGGQNYFYIARRLSSEKAQPLFDAKKSGKFKGVQLDEISGRLYPEGMLASHLLGFTGEGNKGLDGVEIKYDGDLSPKPRKAADGTGRTLDPSRKLPKGATLTLTIDANIQFQIEEIARKALKANGADAVLALAMDVKSGEILAYVNEPGFDPNVYYDYAIDRRKDLLSLYSYEPGSVFKIFSMASILDMGAITPNTVFNCDGAYRRVLPSGEKITIKDLGVYGPQNLAGVLAHSSNAGVGYASDRVSEIDFYERLISFGFASKTGVGLSGESPGSLRDPEKWSARTKPTVAIGQEVQVTALQMIAASGAIANRGFLLKPTTVRKVESADGDLLFEHEPQTVRRVVSEQTSRQILAAMETAASLEGTGWRAKVSDIRMAVKTGTAQMIDPKTRGYSDTDYIASTLGIFPAENPRVALYIAIVKPRGASYLGGQIAAPVLRDAAEVVLAGIDLDRGKSPTVVHGGSVVLSPEKEAIIGASMPDLTGYSKRALLPLLGRADIKVTIEGEGYVVAQNPAPGAPILSGSRVVLTLK